jgi:hypothetical protein
VNGKLWQVEFDTPEVRRELERISTEERGKEAVDGFMRFMQRSPEEGYACLRFDPLPKSRPFHTATNAYLGIYVVDEEAETVICMGIRPIPYGAVDDD